MLMMMIAAKGGSQNCDRIAKSFCREGIVKKLWENWKSFLIRKELSHNCDRIATKKLLGRNCHKIETELWKVFCREEIVTKLLQNCEKFFVMEELSQNCDRIAKSFLSWGRTAALQLRRMSGDHIKSDDGRRQKEKLKPLWNLNIDLIIFLVIHSYYVTLSNIESLI